MIAPKIGYLTPVKIKARLLTFVYQGAVGRFDEGASAAVIGRVVALLAAGEADIAEFHHLPENSPILGLLRSSSQPSHLLIDPQPNPHWTMRVVDEAAFFAHKLRSKRRAWIRRKQRELETAFPERVAWRWLQHFDDLDGVCAALEGVASRTYQRELGAGFVNDEEHRRRFELFASKGQLRMQLLEIDGRIRAYWIGTIYGDTFHSAETGYDPGLRQFEVGTQMFIRMVNNLATEGVGSLDFGLGDALYKQRFGDCHWSETSARLFAPTPKGQMLYQAVRWSGRIDAFGRRVVQRLGILDRVKTGWRRRLSVPDASAEGAAAE